MWLYLGLENSPDMVPCVFQAWSATLNYSNNFIPKFLLVE